MPITDKVAAAKKIGDFLQAVITHGGFKLKYRITVDPPIAEQREWEHPEILVEFAGPDSALRVRAAAEFVSAPVRDAEEQERRRQWNRAGHVRRMWLWITRRKPKPLPDPELTGGWWLWSRIETMINRPYGK